MARNLDIVIPVAGLGRRMKSYGPKCLIQIGGESILSRQIRLLTAAYPSAKIVVVAGFFADRVKKAVPPGVKVVVNPNFETTNVARSIAIGMKHVRKVRATLVVYGDLVYDRDFISNISPKESVAIVGSCPGADSEVGINVVAGGIAHFSYGMSVPWLQAVLLTPKDRDEFIRLSFTEHRARYYTHEILNELIDKGRSMTALVSAAKRPLEVDTSKDIEVVGKSFSHGSIAI